MGKGKKQKFQPLQLYEEKKPLESMPQDVQSGVASLNLNASEFVPGDNDKRAQPPTAPSVNTIPAKFDSEEERQRLQSLEDTEREATCAEALARLLAEGLEAGRVGAGTDLAICVSVFGLPSLWKYGIISSLENALSDMGSPSRASGALTGVRSLVALSNPAFEAFSVNLLPHTLPHFGSKAQNVRTLAMDTAVDVLNSLNVRAARLVLPILFNAMESPDWRVKQGAVQLVSVLAKHSASQINICMPLIVPKVTTCLRDTKKEVSKAAKSSLQGACSVIGNPDIEDVIPSIIAAIKNPDDTPQALEDLLHTTFVHPIDASSLSIIVPVLARSLVGRGMHEKRKAATVVINMCKLVLNPADVEPFVPKLLPELKKCSEEQSFEEIRGICANAAAVLTRAMGEAGIPY